MRFLYVETRAFFMPSGALEMLSFDSVELVAADEDKAYENGRAVLESQQEQRRGTSPALRSHLEGVLVNDYVAAIAGN